MLDVKSILGDPEAALEQLRRRDPKLNLDELVALGEERKAAARSYNELRARQKELSRAFGKKKGAPTEDLAQVRGELKELSSRVKELEAKQKELQASLQDRALYYPNLPAAEVPDGRSEADNVERRSWGEPRREADFELEEHQVLGGSLGILDFPAAARISGARFWVYRGLGARLERALANFMLDLALEQFGYEEVLPPFLVTRESMTGTGQLPKFEEDAFRMRDDDLYLVPTAEVPVTNLHRDEVLAGDRLPIRYAAFSACFRREAGAYGRETVGLTRVHQFQKVELVHFTTPERSAEDHQELTAHAESVLQQLGLPYRVMELCAGDLGFSAQRCYDLEVWLAGQGRWREISSCSNFGDFQARRANIRFKPGPKEKPRFVHTLNGSALAIGRTIMALMEHYQRPDGGIDLPEALWPYMKVKAIDP